MNSFYFQSDTDEAVFSRLDSTVENVEPAEGWHVVEQSVYDDHVSKSFAVAAEARKLALEARDADISAVSQTLLKAGIPKDLADRLAGRL